MDLKSEIRRYVLLNSAAAETASGVMQAWLKLPSGELALSTVQDALEDLVVDGFLERHELLGGAVIYRCAEAAGTREAWETCTARSL